MLSLSTAIGEELAKIEFKASNIITPKLRKKNRIKTLAGTLEIEGNFLGEEKITAILDGKRVLGTYQELREVEGVIAAYERFTEYRYYSLDDLLQAHKLLMNGILKTAGSFRTVNVGVGSKDGVSHVAPSFEVVPQLMQELFLWLKNSDEHPLIKSCLFHYEFEFIHPFGDGNCRVGRLWQSVILYHWKKIFSTIPTESIIRDHQERYYHALEKSGEAVESTLFVEFMLEIILESIKSSVNSSVNTEEKILAYLKDNPTGTIKEIAVFLHLTTRAIEKQIANLKKANRLQRTGSARKGYWEVVL